MLYEAKPEYECCDSNYIYRSHSADYSPNECCGGRFVKSQPEHTCCAGIFYVYVPAGHICCSSSPSSSPHASTANSDSEIRYNIGLGNACCRDVPYIATTSNSTSSQQHHDATQTCCNGELIAARVDSPLAHLAPYLQQQHLASDSFFVDANSCPSASASSFCSADDDEFELVANETTMSTTTTSLTSASRQLVDHDVNAFTSYEYKLCVANSFARTCADEHNSLLEQRTNWSLAASFRHFNYEAAERDDNDNGNDDDRYAIVLRWSPPERFNGPFDFYRLSRNGVEILRSPTALRYVDASREHVRPFVPIRYTLEACNRAGCVLNERAPLLAAARQKFPEQFELPSVSPVSNRSLLVEWRRPYRPNGVLSKYVLVVSEIDMELLIHVDTTSATSDRVDNYVSAVNATQPTQPVLSFPGAMLFNRSAVYSLLVDDLLPNTLYSVQLYACNAAGCVMASQTDSMV